MGVASVVFSGATYALGLWLWVCGIVCVVFFSDDGFGAQGSVHVLFWVFLPPTLGVSCLASMDAVTVWVL